MSSGGGGPHGDKFKEAVNVTGMSGEDQLALVNQRVDACGYNTFLFTQANDGCFILFGYYKN